MESSISSRASGPDKKTWVEPRHLTGALHFPDPDSLPLPAKTQLLLLVLLRLLCLSLSFLAKQMDSIREEEARVVEERKKEMGEQSTAQPSATLYVGDLDAALTEEDLVHAFERFGPVASARICRDSATGSSLRYAYLNFPSHSHAERALKEMNHVRLNGKPIRLMWSYRDPLTLKSGDGNLFVKNLDGLVGGAELEELFTAYGKVLSCKVATDEEGRSKGFGFVQMDSEEAAQSAIEALHGKICCSGSKKLSLLLPSLHFYHFSFLQLI